MLTINASQKDKILLNSFFLWSFCLILLLTIIPVVSAVVGLVTHTPPWQVPKIYELKFYAVAMLFCLCLPFLNQYFPLLLQNDHKRFRLYLIFYCPTAVILYSFMTPDLIRYISVFVLTIIGMGVLFYDIFHDRTPQNCSINSYYYSYLAGSIGLAVFFIALESAPHAFSVFSPWLFVLFIPVFFLIRLANKNKDVKQIFILFLPIMLYVMTFYTMLDVSTATGSVHHYGFFLGPVIEVLYGHSHPSMVDAQYGAGLTAFLSLYFKSQKIISIENMQSLLKALAFTQYFLVYLISASMFRSRSVAVLALVAVLVFNFYSQSTYYYMCPSIGFLRFGLIYLVLLFYLLEGKGLSQKSVFFAVSILGSIAFLWSFESAVYTLPAIFFTEYVNRNLKKFLPIFFICFVFVVTLYFLPFIFEAKWPTLVRYYEYAMVYSGGFGQVPFSRLTSFWWLFPLLYGLMIIRILLGYDSNKVVIVLTVYGISLFTYFVGRADPNNIFHVSIPFILLSIYLIWNLKLVNILSKNILLSFLFVLFFSANSQWVDGGEMIIKTFWTKNLRIGMSHVLPEQDKYKIPALMDQANILACSEFASLNKYKKNNAFALLSEDISFYRLYACTHTHNAFQSNVYLETAINPKAVERTMTLAKKLRGTYFLIDSNLTKSKFDSVGSDMTSRIILGTEAKKVGEVQVGGATFSIFHIRA